MRYSEQHKEQTRLRVLAEAAAAIRAKGAERVGVAEVMAAAGLTHGGFYNHLLKNLMELPNRDNIWFTYNNCALSRIDLTQRGLAFVYLNRFEFMPPELITL